MSLIRVLIVDDHPIVREGLAAIIDRRSDMEVVGEGATGAEAASLFRLHLPDVTLIDLRMPDQNGIEVITLLRREYPAARFIMLTTFDETENVYRAVRAGAKGFLLKDAPREQLLEAVRTVASGGTHLPPDIGSRLADRMNRPEMTAREMEVLRLMAAGHSNQEIGEKLFIAETTVKSHVNNLLRKMEVADRTQAVITALEQGLITLRSDKGVGVE